MQTINQVISHSSLTLAQPSAMQASSQQMPKRTTHSKQPSNELTEAIRLMFITWKARFKNKMQTRNEAEFDWSFPMVLVWAQELTDKRVTVKEFELAKKRSMDLGWMPNNAVEFLRLVRGENINPYPSLETAFHVACQNCGMRGNANRNWTHETVHEAATRIGFGVLASATERFKPEFARVYMQVINEFDNGASFIIPESHRIEQKHIPADHNVADDHLAKIKAMLAGAGA